MKILQVIPSVGPLHGGPSVVVRSLSEGLASSGCEVDVATTDANGTGRLPVPLGRPIREKGVNYWYFRRQVRFYTISWPLSQWLEDRVGDYDVVHIHTLFSFATLFAAYWARHYRVPYIVRPLGTLNRWGMENRRPWLKRASLRLLDGPVLSAAAAVQYTSDDEQQESAMAATGLRRVVIPNPVDLPLDGDRPASGWLRTRYPALARKRTILFLSRLHPIKGIDLLLSSFAQLRSQAPCVALVVGGTGDREFIGQLQRQAAELGVAEDVFWPGFLEGEAKRSVMSEADLFVLPSYSENFGVAVVEAMAAGLPVIVSDQVGLHSEIAAAAAGLVVPCKVDELTGAIASLLVNDDLRRNLARNGIALAKKYSIEAVTQQLLALYEKITCRNGAAQ